MTGIKVYFVHVITSDLYENGLCIVHVKQYERLDAGSRTDSFPPTIINYSIIRTNIKSTHFLVLLFHLIHSIS